MHTGMEIDDVLKFSVECAGDQLDLNLMDEECKLLIQKLKRYLSEII